MQSREITVNARKYDGSIRRHWVAGIVSQTEELTIAVGRFEFDVEHSDLGLVKDRHCSLRTLCERSPVQHLPFPRA